MTDQEIMDEVRDFCGSLLRKQPTLERKAEVAATILSLGYELTRGIEGNEFVAGWLHEAVADLKTNPPQIRVRQLQ